MSIHVGQIWQNWDFAWWSSKSTYCVNNHQNAFSLFRQGNAIDAFSLILTHILLYFEVHLTTPCWHMHVRYSIIRMHSTPVQSTQQTGMWLLWMYFSSQYCQAPKSVLPNGECTWKCVVARMINGALTQSTHAHSGSNMGLCWDIINAWSQATQIQKFCLDRIIFVPQVRCRRGIAFTSKYVSVRERHKGCCIKPVMLFAWLSITRPTQAGLCTAQWLVASLPSFWWSYKHVKGKW